MRSEIAHSSRTPSDASPFGAPPRSAFPIALPLYESERMLNKLEQIALSQRDSYAANPSSEFERRQAVAAAAIGNGDGARGSPGRGGDTASSPRSKWVWPNRPWEAPGSNVSDPRPPPLSGSPRAGPGTAAGSFNMSSSPRARAEARAALRQASMPSALVEELGRYDPRLMAFPAPRLLSPRMSPRAATTVLPPMKF